MFWGRWEEGGNKSVWEYRELGMRNEKREIYIFMERFRRRRKLEEWMEYKGELS